MKRNQLRAVNQVPLINATIVMSRWLGVHGFAIRDAEHVWIRSKRTEALNDAADKLPDFAIVVHDMSPEGKPCGVVEARLPEELDFRVPRWPSLHDAISKLDDGVMRIATNDPQLVLRPLPNLRLAGVHHARPWHQLVEPLG